jgi:hypothetical protein
MKISKTFQFTREAEQDVLLPRVETKGLGFNLSINTVKTDIVSGENVSVKPNLD